MSQRSVGGEDATETLVKISLEIEAENQTGFGGTYKELYKRTAGYCVYQCGVTRVVKLRFVVQYC